MTEVDTYVHRSRNRIPGWLELEDAVLFQMFDKMQKLAGTTGDLLEVGVYQGKSAALMGYFPRGEEKLTVCDLFGNPTDMQVNSEENQTWYPKLAQSKFEQHYLRFHNTLPETLVRSSQGLEEVLGGRSFRMMHIDGSHLYEVVKTDIDLTRKLAGPGNIVIFDDISSIHTPGVTAAVWEAVTTLGLRPLCITKKKMYASWEHQDPISAADVEKALATTKLAKYPYDFREADVVYVTAGAEASLPARVLRPFKPPVYDFVQARIQSMR